MRLTVITGPMFAGKTTELIRRLRAEKRPWEAFKPAVDNRYAVDAIVSHEGRRAAVTVVEEACEIVEGLDAEAVYIDEAQFFGASLVPVVRWLLDHDKQVTVVGLDTDHRGAGFGPMPELLAMADEAVKLRGTCARCGDPSTMTRRKHGPGAQVEVGGASVYESTCRPCHKALG